MSTRDLHENMTRLALGTSRSDYSKQKREASAGLQTQATTRLAQATTRLGRLFGPGSEAQKARGEYAAS